MRSCPVSATDAKFCSASWDGSLGTRFEWIVDRYPDRLAIRIGSDSFSYRQLDRRVNQIAHCLQELTPGAGSRVVLFMETDAVLLAAILGTLKTGLIHVPVDPRYPSDRNATILEDVAPHLVLTAPQYLASLERFSLPHSCKVVTLDRAIDDFPDTSPSTNARADDPALIIYTSGSTGRPKGVVHTNASILKIAKLRSELQGITPEDRMTLMYSCSVMGALYGIYVALMNGASLHPWDVKRLGIANLGPWLRNNRISVYHSVASLFRRVAPILADSGPLPELRLVVLGGERVFASDVSLARAHISPTIRLCCGLGSTETGTVRNFTIGPDTELPWSIVPLGYPVPEMDVLCLDRNHQEVEAGKIGEIAIRGAHLSQGYWRHGTLDRSRFITDPDGGPLPVYLTGDLGRIDADHCLHHCGRIDGQVKIRGFRVEPAEIDAVMTATDGVESALTTTVENTHHDLQLVTYYTLRDASGPDRSRLMAVLRSSLPSYMVPGILIHIAAFPTTPNGKLDLAALPPPCEALRNPGSVPLTLTPTETTLDRIWRQVLGRTEIDPDLSFFDQGGDSLSAVTMFANIEKAFGQNLPLSTFYQAATIRTLGALLDAGGQSKTTWPSVVSLRAGGSGTPLFLVHGIAGNVIFYKELVGRLKNARPLFALQPPMLEGYGTHIRSIEDMATHYVKQIRKLSPEGPYCLGGFSFGGLVALEMARQLRASGHEVENLFIFDSTAPRTRAHLQGHKPRTPEISLRRRFRRWLRDVRKRPNISLFAPAMHGLLAIPGFRIPTRLRSPYTAWVCARLADRYRADILDHPVILFRTPKRECGAAEGWMSVCPRDLKVIPVKGEHKQMFSPQHIDGLCRELDLRLEEPLIVSGRSGLEPETHRLKAQRAGHC